MSDFSISHRKLSGLGPDWAVFRGFSLLFVNPDPWPEFYHAIERAMDELRPRELQDRYGFCALPPLSYHVTAWDGVNDANLASVLPEHRSEAKGLLEAFGEGSAFASPLLGLAAESDLARQDWTITFVLDHLLKRDALTLRLKPVPASTACYEDFIAARARLSAAYLKRFGIAPAGSFVPHLSLGYFANEPGITAAEPHFPEWNEIFRNHLDDLSLAFSTASPYRFADISGFDRITL